MLKNNLMLIKKIQNSSRFNNLVRWWIDLFVNKIGGSHFVSNYARFIIYKVFGADISCPCIPSDCIIYGCNNFSMGVGGYLNKGCFIDATWAKVYIGNNCALGYKTTVITVNHDYSNPSRRAGKVIGKNVVIEDGCWIGANATILPGVIIGKGCVIAAGSVITNNCQENGLYAGIPAKRIREL